VRDTSTSTSDALSTEEPALSDDVATTVT